MSSIDKVRVNNVDYDIGNTPVDTYSTSTDDSYSCNYINGLNEYSTTEQRIGTWIDGKPLYRKMYNLGTLPNKATKTVALNISNLEYVVYVSGTMYSSEVAAQLPYASNVNDGVNFFINGTNLVVQTLSDRRSLYGVAELRYTKTTDTVS